MKLDYREILSRKPRFDFEMDVYKTNGVFLGRSKNVSETGLYVELTQDEIGPKTSETVMLHIHPEGFPRAPIRAVGEVRWSAEGQGVGLSITVIEKEIMEELISFVKAHLQNTPCS